MRYVSRAEPHTRRRRRLAFDSPKLALTQIVHLGEVWCLPCEHLDDLDTHYCGRERMSAPKKGRSPPRCLRISLIVLIRLSVKTMLFCRP